MHRRRRRARDPGRGDGSGRAVARARAHGTDPFDPAPLAGDGASRTRAGGALGTPRPATAAVAEDHLPSPVLARIDEIRAGFGRARRDA